MGPMKSLTSTAEFSQTILSAQTPQVCADDSTKMIVNKKSGGKEEPPPEKEKPKED